MKDYLNAKSRILITLLLSLFIWGHVAWDYFNGGIPVHYILHDDSLPGIPNWWGAILFPFFTYFLLYRIHKRIIGDKENETIQKAALRFMSGLLFAVIISVSFSNDIDIIDYVMGAIFLLALIFPLYKAEYLLGWVLGSAFTFGAIIPIGFGSILCLLFFLMYKTVQFLKGLFSPKTG